MRQAEGVAGPPDRLDTPRRLGSHDRGRPGPLLLALGGIHGNEFAGVLAARRVLQKLADLDPPLRGRFTALAGNLSALALGQRFVDRDLNRSWVPAGQGMAPAAASPEPAGPVEDREQRELLAAVLAEIKTAPGPVHFIDLHTSSADGPPFVTVGDTLRNRAFALALGLPVVLGLEEQVEGALLEYVNNLGHITVGVEAGRHDAPSSVDRHESVLWLALAAAGLLRPEEVPDLQGHRRRLADASPGVPPILEVRHRHPVRPDDRFTMTPGLRNFDPVPARFELARDRRGPVLARRRCRVLLPLYQAQGDDGFFLVFPVRRFWLGLSGRLRRAGLPRLVAGLPGVRAVPERQGEYRVDTRVARFFPLQVLHLMGFRKLRRDGRWLTVSRRREEPPPGPGGPGRPPG